MLFITIRLIFLCLAFTIGFIVIKRINIIHKRKWYLIVFAMVVILTTISALVPIENAFITFSSPESAYQYSNSGDVKLIVDGKETDFIIGAKGKTNSYAIIPKTDRGWKMSIGIDTKRVVQTMSDGIIIYVYQYKNSDDYYITIMDTNGGSLIITDNNNSTFYALSETNSALNKTFYTYYASINGINEQYTLTVNGRTIIVKN